MKIDLILNIFYQAPEMLENPPEGFRFGRCYNKYGKKENA